MKKVGKILFGILEAIIILYVLIVTIGLLCKNKFGYTEINGKTLIIVDEDNITELTEFKEGDLVTIDKIKYNDVKEGDILYYYDTLNASYIIKFGEVTSKEGDNRSAVYEINELAISSDRILGVYDKTYSGLGNLVSILYSRIGFLLIVILPIFLLFIYQVYKMIILLKYNDMEV